MKRSESNSDFVYPAAFDYDFKALDDPDDPLVRSYENFMCVDNQFFRLCAVAHSPNSIRKNASGTGSTIELLIQSCFQYLPEALLAPLIARIPGGIMDQMRANRKIVHRLARGWISDKTTALKVGKGHRDIMTLLGNYLDLIYVLCLLTSLQSRRTALRTQRLNFLNTRWFHRYGQ